MPRAIHGEQPPLRPGGAAFRRKLGWALLLAGTIFFASGWSTAPAVPGPNLHIDKLGHFFAFGLLATLVARSSLEITSKTRALWYGFFAAVLYGISDELHQATNPVRMFSVADAIVDTAGAALAVLCYGFWPRYRRLLEWDLSSLWRRSPSPQPAA